MARSVVVDDDEDSQGALPALYDRYIAWLVLRTFLLVAVALTALFSLLEFVEQLSSVGQGHYGLMQALHYVVFSAPQRLLQVSPVSMLLGCLLALGRLAKNLELTILQALGVSRIRMIGSVVAFSVPLLLVMFIMAEFIIPPLQQSAIDGRETALIVDGQSRSKNSFWAYGSHEALNVRNFEQSNIAHEVEIYEMDQDGFLKTYIHADQAKIHANGQWTLTGVTRKKLDGEQFLTDYPANLDWMCFLTPRQVQFLRLPVESMPPISLLHYIQLLKERGQPAFRYEKAFWSKVSIPIALVAMIMISAPFVFGPPRSQNAGAQIAVGAGVGIVFSLVQQIAGQLGVLLNLNQAVVAFTPSVLLIGLAVYFLRSRDR